MSFPGSRAGAALALYPQSCSQCPSDLLIGVALGGPCGAAGTGQALGWSGDTCVQVCVRASVCDACVWGSGVRSFPSNPSPPVERGQWSLSTRDTHLTGCCGPTGATVGGGPPARPAGGVKVRVCWWLATRFLILLALQTGWAQSGARDSCPRSSLLGVGGGRTGSPDRLFLEWGVFRVLGSLSMSRP